MKQCPECHSENRIRGEFVGDGQPFGGIRFQPEDVVTMSRRPKLQVLACPACGYLEFHLVPEREITDPPGVGTWVFA